MDAPDAAVEVYRSARLADCDERVLVLEAVGVPAAIGAEAGGYGVWVAAGDAGRAYVELTRYAHENRPGPPPPAPVPLHAGAAASAAGYVGLLFAIGALAGHGIPADWYAAGALAGGEFAAGQWWRAVTALTLHGDLAHFLANAGFGALFGGFVARLHGAGRGWLLVMAAAVLANLANGLTMPAARTSIGASTAVFAALGLLGAWRWPQASRRVRLGLRGGSVVAALVLLALLGTGDARTDVAAHAFGFVAGLGLGALLRLPAVARAWARLPQAAAGALVLGTLAGAWTWGLWGAAAWAAAAAPLRGS